MSDARVLALGQLPTFWNGFATSEWTWCATAGSNRVKSSHRRRRRLIIYEGSQT